LRREVCMAVGVLTSYCVNGTTYASYIVGSNMAEVEAAAAARNLNEQIHSSLTNVKTIPDYSLLSDAEFESRLPEILHTACFLSFVALKAGTITIEEALGDEGVLHEVSHLLADIDGCHKKSLTCIRDLVKNLQIKAIGFYQPV
jgi:hypothetical protein